MSVVCQKKGNFLAFKEFGECLEINLKGTYSFYTFLTLKEELINKNIEVSL